MKSNVWWFSLFIMVASVCFFSVLQGGVFAQTPVSVLSAGGYHTVTLDETGSVWAWGGNTYGQLGNGTQTNSSLPLKLNEITGGSDIACGFNHTAILKNDGTVWTWGYNSQGQLGIGSTANSSIPVNVTGLSGISDIKGGYEYTVALRNDGTVWTWGGNDQGQLGDGTKIDKNTPVQVTGLSGITKISAGNWHTVALKDDGTVWTWGSNGYGQLGDGTTTTRISPVNVQGLSGVIDVVCGFYYTIALKNDGTVWGWGSNQQGQLGTGTATTTAPVQIADLTGITAIDCGGYHTIALKNDGTVWTLGYNAYGQLGDGTTTNRNVPGQVIGNIVKITGGSYHTVVVKSDGSVWAWGRNINGQLGDGTTTAKKTPVRVYMGIPTPPSGVTLQSGENWVGLTWSSDIDTASYEIKADDVIVDNGASVSYTHQGLTPNTPHTYMVRAKNTFGAGEWSEAVNGMTLAQSPVLAISNATTSTLDISTTDSNSVSTEYQIMTGTQYITASGTLTTTPTWITLADKTITVTGLTLNTVYSFQAKARNADSVETALSAAVNGKTAIVVASSTKAPEMSADKAIDGNEATRWSSEYNDSEWIYIDLGEVENNIRRVVLNWESHAKEYQIQVSNDARTWTTIYSTTNGDGGIDDIFGLTASGRFVKMQGIKRGTAYGYALYEFKVYTGTEPMAIASSVEAPELSADKAIDGNEATRWSSVYNDSEWICIDLGKIETIRSMTLKWESYAKEYQIQVSNDARTWTTVYSTTNGDGGTDDIVGLTASGKFVKMQGIKRGTPFGYVLYEFKVYTGIEPMAIASSVEIPELSADKAIDGNETTRWSSAYNDSEWICIDLRKVESIRRVVLNWESYAQEYQIQVSNDASTWTTVYSTVAGDGGIDDIAGLTASGRFVKMQGIKRATPFGYGLYEFKVYTGTGSIAVASSAEASELSADNAIDGNEITRWVSAHNDAEWIYIDLGRSKDINRVVLKWDAHALEYQIQVSDNANTWTTVYSTTTGDGGVDDISDLTATGRYVKMQGIKRATTNGYGLYEFEVYATDTDQTAPTIELTPSTTAWTKEDVSVTATLDGTGSNIAAKWWAAGEQTAEYFATGGIDILGDSFAVSTNGTYTVYAKDEAENEAVQTITIDNIDKTAPTQPTIATDTNWTNESSVPVNITGGADDDSGLNRVEYSLAGATTQDWTAYAAAFDVVNEGQTTIDVRSIDNAGNISDSSTATVKIDRTSSTTPELVADITIPTIAGVTVTISNWGDASTKQYRVNGEAWNDYTMPIGMTQNGLIEARGIDDAGNISGIGSIDITNIVYGSVIASSAEAPELSADKATDGDETTRWASACNDSEWIYIDLGEVENIRRVVLNWESYAQEYQIQISNDSSTWTTIYSTTTGDGGIDDIFGLTGSGRFVKMQGIKRGTSYGYSLYEFKVYTGTEPMAVASSVEASWLSADKAIDSDTTTRWSSASNDSEWICIDLGQTENIRRVVLNWEAYAQEYQIQVSNDASTWTTVYSTASGDGGIDDIFGLVASGRFVKMQGVRRGTPYGYGLYEFKVYTGTGPMAVASSVEAPQLSADNAIDGDVSTRWSSTCNDSEWIYIDLGQTENIRRVVLNWESYAEEYEIQVSDDANTWTTVYSTALGDGGIDDIFGLIASGRYVKMQGIKQGTSFGYSLYEFKVYTGTEPMAIASSVEAPTFSADNAIDSDMTTRWSSACNDSEWICIDLGKTENIRRVVLNWESYAEEYQIQVSDDANTWTTVYSTASGDGGIDDISGLVASGRFVKMQGIKRGTTYGYSLYEFKVYTGTGPMAIASSVEAPEFSADKAIDGDETTRWSSACNDSEWIYIDLGVTKNINGVELNWEAYALEYEIQVSDDANTWTTVYSTTTGDGGVDDITGLSVSGRFIKMQGVRRATPYGYALYEFEVYTE